MYYSKTSNFNRSWFSLSYLMYYITVECNFLLLPIDHSMHAIPHRKILMTSSIFIIKTYNRKSIETEGITIQKIQ